MVTEESLRPLGVGELRALIERASMMRANAPRRLVAQWDEWIRVTEALVALMEQVGWGGG